MFTSAAWRAARSSGCSSELWRVTIGEPVVPDEIRALAVLDLQLDAAFTRVAVGSPAGFAEAAYRLAREGSSQRSARAVAALATASTQSSAQAPAAIAAWIRAHVFYRLEGAEEIFAGPAATLAVGMGDCDDLGILWAACVLACGLDARPALARMPGGAWSHLIGAAMTADGAELYELTDPRWYGWPGGIVAPLEVMIAGAGGGVFAPPQRVSGCCSHCKGR